MPLLPVGQRLLLVSSRPLSSPFPLLSYPTLPYPALCYRRDRDTGGRRYLQLRLFHRAGHACAPIPLRGGRRERPPGGAGSEGYGRERDCVAAVWRRGETDVSLSLPCPPFASLTQPPSPILATPPLMLGRPLVGRVVGVSLARPRGMKPRKGEGHVILCGVEGFR